MLKRLGVNIQDALIKIRDDMQYEYRDLITQLETKTNKTIQIVTSDTNDFGVKWDQDFARFQLLMNKKLENNDSSAYKEFANILDDSMQKIEDQLNGNIIKNMNDLTQRVKGLEFLDDKFSKATKLLKSSNETISGTLNDHI